MRRSQRSLLHAGVFSRSPLLAGVLERTLLAALASGAIWLLYAWATT